MGGCAYAMPITIPEENREYMAESEALTASNTRMHMVFAFNYGSRWEITEAARRSARAAVDGELDPDAIDDRSEGDRVVTINHSVISANALFNGDCDNASAAAMASKRSTVSGDCRSS